ncbi:DNA cytosine methyltransferase [Clavibacter tessellarius]|uniref:DNA cytosine methyltransferase n=1 Tax=Clavibacter tessellarius TaxID=31965 RepID=UPI0039BFED79
MSFPDDFKIVGTRADVQRQLGNAVPLGLGKAVVRSLMSQMGYLGREEVSPAVALG